MFLDIDGTLLEIAERPDRVRIPSALPGLLGDLAGQRGGALALISGRPLIEIDRLMQPWRGAAAGLHGSERRRADGAVERRLDPAAAVALDHIRPALREFAAQDGRLLFEDKGEAVALHYRAAPQRAREISNLAEAMQRRSGSALRLIIGKMVVEFQPRGADKGATIAAFMLEPPFAGRVPVFVGDDVTDEDGFAEIARRHGVAIRVGGSIKTRAGCALASVAAVLVWLDGDARTG